MYFAGIPGKRYTLQIPGMLPLSSVSPQILPQTSSQTVVLSDSGKLERELPEWSTIHPLFSLEFSGNAKCWVVMTPPDEHTSEGGRDDRGVPYHAESTLSSAQVLKCWGPSICFPFCLPTSIRAPVSSETTYTPLVRLDLFEHCLPGGSAGERDIFSNTKQL